MSSTTSKTAKTTSTNVYLDKNIMDIFEEKEDMFSFPLTTAKQARDFVKFLDRRGCPYDVLCRELHEEEENFRNWRLGGNKPEIGKHVLDRINKPFQETMFSVSEKDDKDFRNYTFKDFYQQFSVEEEKTAGDAKCSETTIRNNTNSAVINGKKVDSKKLPSVLVKESSVPKSPESGVDAKQLKINASSLSSSSLSPLQTSSLSSPISSPTLSPISSPTSKLSSSTSQLNRIRESVASSLSKSQSTDLTTDQGTPNDKQAASKLLTGSSLTQKQILSKTTPTATVAQTATKTDSVPTSPTAKSSNRPSNTFSSSTTSLATKTTTASTAAKTSTETTSIISSPSTVISKTTASTPSRTSATAKAQNPSTTSTLTSTTATTTKTTTSPSSSLSLPPPTSSSLKPDAAASATNESEEAERPPSPVTTSAHYQPFIHNYTAEDLTPMINYNSDNEEVATPTAKDEPGYIYLFSDIPSGNLAISKYTKFRVKINCSKYPEKRLKQAMLFNPDIKMIASIKVPLMKKTLNDAKPKLKIFLMKNKADWYWGTLNGIFSAIESIL